jgi:hypothetical protein
VSERPAGPSTSSPRDRAAENWANQRIERIKAARAKKTDASPAAPAAAPAADSSTSRDLLVPPNGSGQ